MAVDNKTKLPTYIYILIGISFVIALLGLIYAILSAQAKPPGEDDDMSEE